ncbi:hypothetical protein LTR85_008323 [Meristemomyces frigidus]|nr:hypothetical protein LTR85_008323 [Meristemomyces frigidus]
MSPIPLEAYEYPFVTTLYKTYNLNTASGAGMTPNQDNAFRRWPAPEIAPDQTEDGQAVSNIDKLLQLPLLWEGTLHMIPECHLYDGTPQSETRFLETTGLTPLRFAQAWLECQGSIWRYFHPCTPGGGPAVTEAMCVLWAEKARRWRPLPTEVIKANILRKIGGEKGVAQLVRVVCVPLSSVASLFGKGKEEAAVRRLLEITESLDCPTHPWVSVCRCAVAVAMPIQHEVNVKGTFIQVLEGKVIASDEAFLYTGSAASAKLFQARASQTVAAFADAHIDGMSVTPFWKVLDRQALRDATLAWWAQQVRVWRETCKTRREARTKYQELLKEDGNLRKISYATGESTAIDLHEDDSSEEDALCRYVGVKGAKAGHRHTEVLYAKIDSKGDFGYDVLRKVPCHPACGFGGGVEVDGLKLAAPFLKEDRARAEKVKAEW